MKIAIPKETAEGERRVALVPDTATKLIAAGLQVSVQAGAGASAYLADSAYQAAGVTVEPDESALFKDAGAVLKVQPPDQSEVRLLPRSSVLISFLQPATEAGIVHALAAQGVTAFSLELVPRISRAQSAGVAGLQAIATARRLGAVVSAYDVRPAVKEEVQSLGATFIELPLESQEGEGGYAREQSEEFLRKQRELIGEHVAKSDVVITTAAVPGRRAPLLVTAEMVKGMRAGSIIVDLAAESGGNVELTKAGSDVDVNGVLIMGRRNVPSTMPLHASQLYARNVANLLLHLVKDGAINLDFQDEITKGACVTHAGEIVSERAKQLLAAAS